MTVKPISRQHLSLSMTYVGAAWRKLCEAGNTLLRRRETIRKLQWLGDRDLADIGLQRSDIPKVARKSETELRPTVVDDDIDIPNLSFGRAGWRLQRVSPGPGSGSLKSNLRESLGGLYSQARLAEVLDELADNNDGGGLKRQ